MSKNKKQATLSLTEQQAKPHNRRWTFQQPQAAIYENPKSTRKLNFTDRLNTNYIVEDEPIEELTNKDTTTYKDYIVRALDPNIDSNNNVYGIAKKMEPLTTRINRMKANIESANSQLGEYMNKAKLLAKEAIKARQEQKQEQKQEEVQNVQDKTKQETEPSTR